MSKQQIEKYGSAVELMGNITVEIYLDYTEFPSQSLCCSTGNENLVFCSLCCAIIGLYLSTGFIQEFSVSMPSYIFDQSYIFIIWLCSCTTVPCTHYLGQFSRGFLLATAFPYKVNNLKVADPSVWSFNNS